MRWLSVLVVTLMLPITCVLLQEKAGHVKVNASVPRRIAIPKSIPSWERIENWKTGDRLTIFPSSMYQEAYFVAWNEYLYQYGFLGKSLEECDDIQTLVALNLEPYSGWGIVDGLAACGSRIRELLRASSAAESRSIARRDYVNAEIDRFVFRRRATEK